MKRNIAIAICAVAGFGCSNSSTSDTQVITGTITTANAIAVRAIVGTQIATAAQVRSDGSFVLSLPAGQRYRLEVLDGNGVHHLVTRTGATYTDLAFKVCHAGPPMDCGGIGTGDPSGGTGGGGGPGDPPPKCDPSTDPTCTPPDPCGPDGTCPPPPPKCTDPSDPTTCCDPTTGTGCDPGGGGPPPSPCDADGSCPPSKCTDATDPACPPPPPPCADPSDPSTCQDPCMDPASCGCTTDDPSCWPAPKPCDAAGNCDPGTGPDGGMTPANPPGDIGCE